MKVTKILDITKEGEWMIASSPSADRDKDRINPLGIKTESFERNPVLFYGHNYHDPWAVIGRIPEFIRSGADFRFKPELRAAANDADPMNIVKLLWDSKLLNASSIGFMPIKGTHNEIGGIDYEEIELLEISLVPLPANQDALRLAMKALESTEPVTKDFTGFLEQKRGRVLSTKNEQMIRTAYDNLEAVLSSLGTPEEPEDEPMEESITPSQQKQTDTNVSDALLEQTDSPAEPPTTDPAPLVDDLTTHDESEAALDEFAKALINLVNNWSK